MYGSSSIIASTIIASSITVEGAEAIPKLGIDVVKNWLAGFLRGVQIRAQRLVAELQFNAHTIRL